MVQHGRDSAEVDRGVPILRQRRLAEMDAALSGGHVARSDPGQERLERQRMLPTLEVTHWVHEERRRRRVVAQADDSVGARGELGPPCGWLDQSLTHQRARMNGRGWRVGVVAPGRRTYLHVHV